MNALKSFLNSRKGIVYLLTVITGFVLYFSGDLTGEMLLGIVGGGGAVFQLTTAWEDTARSNAAAPQGATSMSFTATTEATAPAPAVRQTVEGQRRPLDNCSQSSARDLAFALLVTLGQVAVVGYVLVLALTLVGLI